jgi:hypothetical protein
MNELKRELIDESSTLSSSRWSLVTCIQCSIILAFIAIGAYIICFLIGKPLPDGFLGGCRALITIIIAIPTTGKAVQSFSEYNNHYFDKYSEENKSDENFKEEGK